MDEEGDVAEGSKGFFVLSLANMILNTIFEVKPSWKELPQMAEWYKLPETKRSIEIAIIVSKLLKISMIKPDQPALIYDMFKNPALLKNYASAALAEKQMILPIEDLSENICIRLGELLEALFKFVEIEYKEEVEKAKTLNQAFSELKPGGKLHGYTQFESQLTQEKKEEIPVELKDNDKGKEKNV